MSITHKKINRRIILIFYLVAFLSSTPFWLFDLDKQFPRFVIFDMNPLAPGGLFTALGPFIAGIIAVNMDRKVRKQFSITGTSMKGSILFLLIFIGAITAFGIHNEFSGPHVYAFAFSVYIILYGIGEEYGWRGYLQHALGSMRPILKYLIIGTLWWFWHIGWYIHWPVSRIFLFWIIWIAISFGIGKAMEETKSVAVAACFHILGNILVLMPVIPAPDKLSISGIMLGGWILILIFWKKMSFPLNKKQG